MGRTIGISFAVELTQTMHSYVQNSKTNLGKSMSIFRTTTITQTPQYLALAVSVNPQRI